MQLMEDLEQLKVLENGYKMKVVVVDHCAHGVDVPSDVDDIVRILQKQQGMKAPTAPSRREVLAQHHCKP